MRIITWNCHHATKENRLWEYLLSFRADIALLQEVGSIPTEVLGQFEVVEKKFLVTEGGGEPYSSVILSTLPVVKHLSLGDEMLGAQIQLPSERLLNVVSVYIPEGVVVKPILFTSSELMQFREQPWIFAGDFAVTELIDEQSPVELSDCLRAYNKGQLPQVKSAKGGVITHQFDKIGVTTELASVLTSCIMGTHERVFGTGMSDHVPVIADFKIK